MFYYFKETVAGFNPSYLYVRVFPDSWTKRLEFETSGVAISSCGLKHALQIINKEEKLWECPEENYKLMRVDQPSDAFNVYFKRFRVKHTWGVRMGINPTETKQLLHVSCMGKCNEGVPDMNACQAIALLETLEGWSENAPVTFEWKAIPEEVVYDDLEEEEVVEEENE